MTHTLHLVSHTHWDREWYLTFQQFRLKLVHLVDELLETLDKDDNFSYFMLDGQTIVLDDYLHMRPENETLLRQYVQNGRLQIGPWHLLPDMFLVSPEAHIRNLLQGRRTGRRFGPLMQVGYIPDPFGHPGQLPQILRGFGIQTAVLWRGLGDQPCEFWWQAPDGSRVLLAFLRESYSNGASLSADEPAQFTAQLAQARDLLAPHAATSHLLVMFGTDHMEPAASTPAAIAYANTHLPEGRVLQSTLPAYFQALTPELAQKELPTVRGELRECSRSPLLPGVLSTRMWIKQRNTACETLLEKWVEPFSTFAARAANTAHDQRLGNTAPLIRQTWRLLMENHPHDSICGCSVDQVAVEMAVRFDQVEQMGEELTRQSLQVLAAQVDTRLEGALAAVVIFNPSSTPRRDLLQADLAIPSEIPAFELLAEDGAPLPYELLGSEAKEFANLVVDRKGLREMFGNIHEGRAAGVSIVQICVGVAAPTVNIDAVVSEQDPPDLAAWRSAEEAIAALQANPTVTHFHIRARMQRSSHLRFLSPEVPAFGWAVVWARPAQPATATQPASIHPLLRPFLPLALRVASAPPVTRLITHLATREQRTPPFVIENEFLRLEASPQDGTLTLSDKSNGALYGGLNRFVDGGDAGDEYNYSPPDQDELITAQLRSLKVVHNQLVQRLEITYRLRLPASLSADRKSRSPERVEIPLRSTVSLTAGLRRVEIQTEVDNRAADHRLRVHFPVPFAVSHADHDSHFEVVRRRVGVPQKGPGWVEDPRPETHQRAFTDVSDGQLGLMLANRGLPEVEVMPVQGGSEIALTLLRCVGWLSRDDLPVRRGHAGPGSETPGAQVPGGWRFAYALIPHAGGWQVACQQAFAFAAPPRAVTTELHAGTLAQSGSFLSSSPPEFAISAVKEAEDGVGWLVRGYNLSGEALQVTLKPWQRFATAMRCNLAEEPLSPLGVAEDGSLSFAAGAHEVVTVRLS